MRVRGPQEHSQVWWFIRRTHRTQRIVYSLLIFIIAKGSKAKSANKKAHGVKSARNKAQASKSPLSVDMLNSSSNKFEFDNMCEKVFN